MEEQAEEYEVLDSIYGSGDEAFKAVSSSVFQYKFGDDGNVDSFLLEIKWSETYPAEVPTFNLDAFYNQHLSQSQKSAILKLIREESNAHVGEQQTFTIIEWVRDSFEKLSEVIKVTSSLHDTISISRPGDEDDDDERKTSDNQGGTAGGPKVKKEQLSKSQKRKEWDRVDAKGEKPRGHDWIDVVKHLSQTGGSN